MNQLTKFKNQNLTKLFIRCSFQGMVSMLFTSLFSIIDGIFVGQFLGEEALASVNLVFPIIMIMFAFSNMIAVGSSVQISIAFGMQEIKRANKIFSFSVVFIVAISIFFTIFGLIFNNMIVSAFGGNENVTKMASSYFSVFLYFAPVTLVFFGLDNYLRACGKQSYSMFVNICTALLSIFLDWLFLVQFRMGIAAAGVATCLSITAGTILSISPFLFKKLNLKFTKPVIKFKTFTNIILNGCSDFFTTITTSIMTIIINLILMKLVGSLGVASYSIIMYIDGIVISLIYGMSDSVQPAISYNYGANDFKRVLGLEFRTLFVGLIVSLSVMLTVMFNSETIVKLFVGGADSEMLSMTSHAMKLYFLAYLFIWFNIIINSFFTALNKMRTSLILAFTNSLILPLIGLGILTTFLKLDGIWLTTLFANSITFFVSLGFLIYTIRKSKHKKLDKIPADL